MTIQEAEQKRILDACCGSKMFWFDKNNPDVVYTDIREVPYHEYYPDRYIEIAPDIICDFQELPFADNTFHLVVFDPPHLPDAGDNSIMALKYGCLKGDWKEQLSKGFDECMRVLRPNGILVFKWSEQRIALADILKCFSQRPLFGNRCRKKGNTTHWLCFMKDEPILSQADRKTEPNCSEKPNNLQTCANCKFDHEEWFEEACDSCCDAHSNWQPKTESTISKMEQVDKDTNVRSKYDCKTCAKERKQAMIRTYTLSDGTKVVFEYDHNGIGKITLESMDILMSLLKATVDEDEPQTDCAWGKGEE